MESKTKYTNSTNKHTQRYMRLYNENEEFREKARNYIANKNYERYNNDIEYRERKKEQMRVYHRSLVEAKEKLLKIENAILS